MNDADLNALFAQTQAGYYFSHMADVMDLTGSGEKAIYVSSKTGHRATANQLHFTTSMDAVLPYLEKWAQTGFVYGTEIVMTSNNEWRVVLYDGTTIMASVEDKSLARACVLALLRANDVDIWE